MKKITALAALLAIPAMAAPAGYFQVPGTETTLKVYGWAQTQAAYTMDGGYEVGAGLGPESDHQSFTQHDPWSWRARGQFGFTSTTPSPYGDVKMKVEFRATNDGGSANMRHCYGEIGNLLIGNTDSIFADWDASPNYIDSDGVLGDFYGNGRVLQVRWTQKFTDNFTGQFAIEKDKTGSNRHYFPGAFVAALNYGADWGHVRASVAFAKRKDHTGATETAAVWGWDDTDDDPTTAPVWSELTAASTTEHTDISKSVTSWGLGANYVIGKGNITAQLFSGNGFYGVDYLDTIYTDRNDADKYVAPKVLGWTLGYSHELTDTITVAGGVGQAKWKRNNDLEDGEALYWHTYTVTNYFANIQWQATKTASFKAEIFHADAKASKGRDGMSNKVYDVRNSDENASKIKENRLNLQAQFNFF